MCHEIAMLSDAVMMKIYTEGRKVFIIYLSYIVILSILQELLLNHSNFYNISKILHHMLGVGSYGNMVSQWFTQLILLAKNKMAKQDMKYTNCLQNPNSFHARELEWISLIKVNPLNSEALPSSCHT